jgi:hypothetical protein
MSQPNFALRSKNEINYTNHSKLLYLIPQFFKKSLKQPHKKFNLTHSRKTPKRVKRKC